MLSVQAREVKANWPITRLIKEGLPARPERLARLEQALLFVLSMNQTNRASVTDHANHLDLIHVLAFNSILFLPEIGRAVAARPEKLKALARTYGYVRYFHPSDQASRID